MMLDEHAAKTDREREALQFLWKGRELRGLSPVQFRRIESRLASPKQVRRPRRWVPVLAGLALVLLAGSALARVVDLSRLPLVGPLFGARQHAPAPHAPRAYKPLSPETVREAPAKTAAPALPAQMPAAPGLPSPVDQGQAKPDGLPAAVHSKNTAEPRKLAGLAAPSQQPSHAKHAEGPSESPSPAADARFAGAAHPILDTRSGYEAQRPATITETRGLQSVTSSSPVAAPSPLPRSPRTNAGGNQGTSESQSFSAALALWHREHAAAAALAALDAHERRFPQGQMQVETTLLRAQILLHQGQEKPALAALDRVSLQGLPRGRELQTVRGELRIKHGRCSDGRSDLDQVLAQDRTDALARRALHALALCP